ncbi:hypothetical protein BB559_001777 [Furculomyces boomerangus]|uniref:Kinetochore protein SPC25 n=2 Tax=Harpellales TaxID=61421 RepID=A0A2T9Z0K2_9FUNG|nr:hypothetical protein BB559_001777 [Furculomyces boomerangus]PWA02899.1 hypothetical protein BB558_000956 [Smittium angustum]
MIPSSPLPFLATPRRKAFSPGTNSDILKTIRPFTASKIRKSLLFSSNVGTDHSLLSKNENEIIPEIEEYQTPQHSVNSDYIKDLTANFLKQFDEALREWQDLSLQKKQKNEKLIDDLLNRENVLYSNLSSIKGKGDGISKKLEIERAQNMDLENLINSIQASNKELSLKAHKLRMKKDQLYKDLHIKNNELNAKKKMFSDMQSICQTEVRVLEKLMGLEIISEKENELTFIFTRLTKKNPNTSIKIKIDLSMFFYKVTYCSMVIKSLDELVEQLNESRDVGTFLKNVRYEALKQLSE